MRPPGESFNPWRGDRKTPGCGFYPPKVVARQRSLGDGPKRVYERLVRFAGQNGRCYPSQETLAEELGKSTRQIQRDLKELEAANLIAHQRRERKRSNTYVFLWHPMFEEYLKAQSAAAGDDLRRRPCPLNDPVDTTDMTNMSEFEATDMTPSDDTYDALRRHGCPPNSVQEYKHMNLEADAASAESSQHSLITSVVGLSTGARAKKSSSDPPKVAPLPPAPAARGLGVGEQWNRKPV